MRTYGALNPIDQVAMPSDSVQTLLIANSSGQAMDWVGSTVNAADASVGLALFSGVTTANALMQFQVNLETTRCAAVSSGQTTGSTAAHQNVQGSRLFQIPGGSTGFSVASLSSGYITVECWKR